ATRADARTRTGDPFITSEEVLAVKRRTPCPLGLRPRRLPSRGQTLGDGAYAFQHARLRTRRAGRSRPHRRLLTEVGRLRGSRACDPRRAAVARDAQCRTNRA